MNAPKQSSRAQNCPDCGTLLSATLPAGLCPVCLLQKGIAPTDSEIAQQGGELSVTRTQAWNPNRSSSPTTNELAELTDGQQFGDYQIVRRLGRGGMGTVYEADHHPTGRRVALKVLTHALDNREARARFLREGRLAASINHPNSVYVYGTEEIEGTPTISMELIRGGTLQQWVLAAEQIDVAAAADAILQIIDGLEAADRKGVLHRDVKPANCFIDPSGMIKVGDFGLSITTSSRDDELVTQVTREGSFLGTPAFASPEQLRGEPLDRRSDIYSVGVTLFYLLTGRTPFTGENMVQLLATVLDKPAPTVESIRPDVPDAMSQLVARCLQKSAGQRYPSYESLREALVPLSSQTQTPAPPSARLLASLTDYIVLGVCSVPLNLAFFYLSNKGNGIRQPSSDGEFLLVLIALIGSLLYYAISEWRFGMTIGKYVMGIRVVSLTDRLRLSQTTIRAAIFSSLPMVPSFLNYAIGKARPNVTGISQDSTLMLVAIVTSLLYYVVKSAIFITMRERNGYAGWHGLCSDTRVIITPHRMQTPQKQSPDELFESGTPSEKIGPYDVLQEQLRAGDQRVVLCYDTKLLRRVWIHVQKPGAAEVDHDSRNHSRPGRLRWLGGKRSANECWDCYEAPGGQSLNQFFDSGVQNGIVDWQTAIRALHGLASELKQSRDEGSLPARTTLNNVWVAEENTVKLLPFSPASQHDNGDTGELATGSGEVENLDTAARRILEEATDRALNAFSSIAMARPEDAIPLSVRRSLADAAQSDSLDAETDVLAALAKHRPVNVARRVRGILAASMFLPAIMVLSGLLATFLWSQELARDPKVQSLAQDHFVLKSHIQTKEIYESVPSIKNRNRSLITEVDEKIETAKTWIAGNYRELIEDEARLDTVYGKILIQPADLGELRALIDERSPSAEETAKAGKLFDLDCEERNAQVVKVDVSFFSASGTLAGALYQWLMFIWIPSLITAMIARGGVMMWLFGLTFVNSNGEPASRLRIFCRMLIGGLPMFLIAAAGTGLVATTNMNVMPLAMWFVVMTVTSIAFCRPLSMIHDRLAGTRLVADRA